MRRRIYVSMMLLSSVSILLVSAVICFVFYERFTERVHFEIRSRAESFVGESYEDTLNKLKVITPADLRVTIILPDKSVVFDNVKPNLGKHIDRAEIEDAISFGEGQSSRFSSTLGEGTYYYALRLADGSVLRFSKTFESIWQTFAASLPVVFFVVLILLVLSYFVARALANRVVEPINGVNFSDLTDAPYDELVPFVKTIEKHRRQVAKGGAELERRTKAVRLVMDKMNEGVVLVNRRAALLFLNKSAEKMFEAGIDLEGRSVLELVRNLEFFEAVKKALTGSGSEMSVERLGRTYRAFISPVPQIGAVILFLDVTDSFYAEKLRREFSANVSHELKTPLTSIYGYAQLLSGGLVKDADKGGVYKKIVDESARLIALIDDIIMISELDEKKVEYRRETVDVVGVARECMEALKEKALAYNVVVSVEGSGILTANRTLIYELIYNLLGNAIKYNKKNGNVWIDIAEKDGKLNISVKDNGIGIADSDKERIFERFYRVDKSRSKKSGGTGLGLAIVKHIVLSLNGTISVDSKEGLGTKFVVKI